MYPIVLYKKDPRSSSNLFVRRTISQEDHTWSILHKKR
jgi:hypothetical protein